MGYYIETPNDIRKADWLLMNASAIEVFPPIMGTDEMIPVCVVSNGPFDAAGICFDKQEVEAFSQPGDDRRKRWLLLPRAQAIKLNPKVEQHLKW